MKSCPMTIIAAAAHMANRAYCIGIGDDSQPTWEQAPAWQQDSAIAGATATLRDPEHTPEQSHAGWLAQKVADGWTYGPAKDPEKKQHPCMVSYDKLPEAQRMKDSIFIDTVRTMKAAIFPDGAE